MVLKPNIRYALHGGETIKFADVTARYYITDDLNVSTELILNNHGGDNFLSLSSQPSSPHKIYVLGGFHKDSSIRHVSSCHSSLTAILKTKFIATKLIGQN